MIRLLYICLKNLLTFLEPYVINDENEEDKFDYPELELKYFDMKGLAESIRMSLNYFDVPFIDTRLTKEEFTEEKESLLFGQVPEMTIIENKEETSIVQSKAILRYVGKLTRMYPSKIPIHAALIDQWIELHTEFMFPLTLNMYSEKFGLMLTEHDKVSHRKWCIDVHIPKYLRFLDDELEHGNYLGDMDDPSIADFCWLSTIQWLASGTFDGVDATALEDFQFVKSYKLIIENLISGECESECEMDDNDEPEVDNEEKKIL